jgi:hypothetical protein
MIQVILHQRQSTPDNNIAAEEVYVINNGLKAVVLTNITMTPSRKQCC